VGWRDFLITEELAVEDVDDETADPEYKQPENYEDTDYDSSVSDEELHELQAVEKAIKDGTTEGHLDIDELSQVLETVAIIDKVPEESKEGEDKAACLEEKLEDSNLDDQVQPEVEEAANAV
jgi:hypothetical protein